LGGPKPPQAIVWLRPCVDIFFKKQADNKDNNLYTF
jgi:hypothetical protein